MNRKKWMVLLLAAALVLGVLPVRALGAPAQNSLGEREPVPTLQGQSGQRTEPLPEPVPVDWDHTATVYVNMSHDADFLQAPGTGMVLGMYEMTVPYFDLANYGLEEFYFRAEQYEVGHLPPADPAVYTGRVTLMHAILWLTETCYEGLDPEQAGLGYLAREGILGTDTITITGSAGSSYLSKLWDRDENMNYRINLKFPQASEQYGSTSDQALLHDGDLVSIAHFTDWSFYTDPLAGMSCLETADGTWTRAEVVRGEPLELTAKLAGGAMGGEPQFQTVTSCPEIYCMESWALRSDMTDWMLMGQAGPDGRFTLDTAGLEPGTYVVGFQGQKGGYIENVASSPAALLLEVRSDQPPVAGDLDGDGEFSLPDVMELLELYNHGRFTDSQTAVTDVNGDGETNLRDVMQLLRLYNGK